MVTTGHGFIVEVVTFCKIIAKKQDPEDLQI